MNWKKEFREFIKEENQEHAKEMGYIDLPIEKVQYFIKTLLKKQEKEMIKEIEKRLIKEELPTPEVSTQGHLGFIEGFNEALLRSRRFVKHLSALKGKE